MKDHWNWIRVVLSLKKFHFLFEYTFSEMSSNSEVWLEQTSRDQLLHFCWQSIPELQSKCAIFNRHQISLVSLENDLAKTITLSKKKKTLSKWNPLLTDDAEKKVALKTSLNCISNLAMDHSKFSQEHWTPKVKNFDKTNLQGNNFHSIVTSVSSHKRLQLNRIKSVFKSLLWTICYSILGMSQVQ